MLAVFWLAAFAHFLQQMPSARQGDSVSTNAIVVLTGGQLRIAYGFELLEKGKAQQLFITGVGDNLGLNQLLASHGATDDLRALANDGTVRIALDYSADSTHGNAEQTAKWAKAHSIRSLRMVTANYHIPRSLIEFRRAMPELEIIPDPVFPEPFDRPGWWRHPAGLRLVLSEFHKYLVAWLYGQVV